MTPKSQIPLNSAQKAAAEAGNAPLLIVAGAGTGKTRTLTTRIAHLIKRGTPPERICAITFTNKAAKEMVKRVGVLLGDKEIDRKSPLIGTFHSFGARILRKECRFAGRDPNFTIFDDHDSFDLIKKAVKGLLPKREGPMSKRNKEETPAYFGQKISKIKNVDGALDEEKNPLIAKAYEKYEAALKANNAFDFDDLIGKVVDIWKTHPEVLAKYQNMFDAVLVDEYQDINPKQYDLISLLAGKHRNLSVVGDDEQTIYSWRYANIKTFLDFDKMWKGAGVHFLEENYRSTGVIIRAAAAVSKNNTFRAPKNLWTQNPDGDPIILFEAWGENEEAAWIAEKIETLRAGNREAEIAILYRTNAQSRSIEQALIRHEIPYRIFGGLKFYERREVKDVVAGLRWIANSKDEISKERLEKNLTKRKFAEFKERVQAGKKLSLTDAIKVFLESFGYFDYLEQNFINADEREENVAELITFAGSFEDLNDLLERLSLLQAADDIEAKTDDGAGVSLMTIHLAKGLEFDSVFIAGAAEGLLPHGRSLEDEHALEEERRLMYVAMTRARKRLFISFSGMPSRFLSEIPEDCMVLENSGGENGYDGYEERSVSLDE